MNITHEVRTTVQSKGPSNDFKAKLVPFLNGEKEAFATTLLLGLVKTYTLDLLQWDGITIQFQVYDDFDIDMPRIVYDKLLALITCLNTDAVYTDIIVFDKIVSALNGGATTICDGAPSVEDVAWAVNEIRLNDPVPVSRPPNDPWAPNVARYVKAVLTDEGFTIPPKVLSFAGSSQVGGTTNIPFLYTAGWQGAQSKADEIDQWVDRTTMSMIQTLSELDINLTIVDEEDE